jgi:hypothetical protein
LPMHKTTYSEEAHWMRAPVRTSVVGMNSICGNLWIDACASPGGVMSWAHQPVEQP